MYPASFSAGKPIYSIIIKLSVGVHKSGAYMFDVKPGGYIPSKHDDDYVFGEMIYQSVTQQRMNIDIAPVPEAESPDQDTDLPF